MTDSRPAITFSVLTVNLRFGLADDGVDRWEYRKNVFAPLMQKYPADFLLTQEANDFQADFLAGLLPGHGMVGRRDPAPPYWQHNLVFYKKDWALLDRDYFFLSPTPDIPSRFVGSKWPRQCSMGLFEKHGLRLAVAVAHLDFDETVKERQARVLVSRLDPFSQNGSAVLGGDFNARPDSAAHAVFLDPAMVSPPFADTFPKDHPQGTHHGFSGHADKNGRIDWILFRGNLDLIEKTIITESFRDWYPSDHFPVFARFSLRS